MHDLAPFYLWRELYDENEDSKSPFYGQPTNILEYSNKVYNYFIHPDWDPIGSETLYAKLLFADYEEGIGIIELIGEWNDCINNDIMYLKRELIDPMTEQGIYKFIVLCEYVFNFHGSDDCYYEEWKSDLEDKNGYIVFLNVLPHVLDEIKLFGIHHYVNAYSNEDDINWRKMNPMNLVEFVESKL